MATNKKKKEVKVRDLKPSKDAKGGVARLSGNQANSASLSSARLNSTPAIHRDN
jgi:hypothetical protein